jgi:hypothetical protein
MVNELYISATLDSPASASAPLPAIGAFRKQSRKFPASLDDAGPHLALREVL